MYCNNCGRLVPRGSKFCRHCGTRLDVPGAVTLLPDEFYLPKEKMEPQKAEQARSIFKQAFEASEQGDINQAISLCKQAVALDPSYAPAHSLLGMLYERVGDKRAAYAEYEIALRLNPYSAADKDALKRLRKELGLLEAKLEHVPSSEPPHARSLPLVAVTTFAIALIFIVRAFYKPKLESAPDVNIASVITSAQPNIQQPTAQDAQQKVQRLIADAISARQRGNYDEALRLLYQAMSLSPNDERIQKLVNETAEQKRERTKLAAATQGQRTHGQQDSSAQRRPSQLPVLPPVTQPQPTQVPSPRHLQAYQGMPQQARPSNQTAQPPQLAQPTQPQFVAPRVVTQPYPLPYYPPNYFVRPPTPPQTQPPIQQFTQQPTTQQEQQGEVEGGSGHIIVRAGGKVKVAQKPSPSEQRPQEQPQIASSVEFSVEELERKAIEAHFAGNLNTAISLYIQALEHNTDIAREGRLRQSLADAYRQSNRLREAMREYRRAIDAYQRQLKMGVGDQNEIEIAIRACKQGLKMCEQ
ncbi:MAG: zinc-ribbon domain-containing protein [Armatimonadota bacterium]|nr:zinc-ribbon domain-containing protein [Armatimonadota bacterium]MDW8024531.1 zinc-ribbon domain-containing protein [Armatimonadota bacterium]